MAGIAHFTATAGRGQEQTEALRFLEGICQEFAPVLVPLKTGEKRSPRSWDRYIRTHAQEGGSCLAHAKQWLSEGQGIGLLPRNGLWVLDCDTQEAKDSAEEFQIKRRTFCPRVETPSGGVHLYFRIPGQLPTGKLKHHVCRPKTVDDDPSGWDFKLGERTLLVAPGTRRNGLLYQPQTAWFTPPVVDPRELHPGLQLFRETKPYLPDPRDHDQRTRAAIGYLRHARPAVVGEMGRLALRDVTSNLTVFFGLDPEHACYLLSHPASTSWNARCRPPWSHWDLWRACEASVNDSPPLGVARWHRVHRTQALDDKFPSFLDALTAAAAPGEWCLTSDAWAEFLNWSGIEADCCTPKAFGTRVYAAGWARKLRTGARLASLEGVSLPHLHLALTPLSKGEATPQNNNPLYLEGRGRNEAS